MTTLDVAARLYLGRPFLHQGRNPAVGIDCIGLLVCACLRLGREDVTTFDRTDYAPDPHGGVLETQLAAALSRVTGPLSPGLIVSMRWAGAVRHVGIVGQGEHGLSLIHTSRSIGRVVEHSLDAKWQRRIVAAYSLGSV